jgi:hypothetical protein
MIRNDNGEPAGYIYVYLRDVTAPEYVERAREHLQANLQLPAGYSIEWTGLYQYAEEARATLSVVVPITLIIMFVLLMLAFRSVADSSLIMLSAPFALVGGVFLQWQQGFSMTTAVIIGYVSLFAVAIQTGIIMIEFIREALAHRTPEQTYMDAVIEGSAARLRPKLMTVATTVLGLLPIMLATGSGMDITRPIATPTFGGMISSTIYVLFLIPCLFAIGEDIRRRKIVTSTVASKAAMSIAAIILALATASCTRESAPESTQTTQSPAAAPAANAQGVSVQFSSEPNPPVSGDNQIEVMVMENGAPVTDATVEAVFSMPAMPSMNMPAMRSAAPLTHAGEGRYRGTGQLSMGGTWNVTVTASRGGQEIGRTNLSIVAK